MTFKKIPVGWLLLILINLVIGLSLVLQQTKPSQIGERLDAIQAQLDGLQHAVKAPAETIDLSAINREFNRLTALVTELKLKDDSQLNQLVVDSRTQLANKLDAMHTVIASLDKKHHPIKYLPSTALPFKIISIDSIQESSVASVAYDFKIIPLEKNDALAGWTVLSIDFSKQSMELENANKERVVVTMDGVDQHA